MWADYYFIESEIEEYFLNRCMGMMVRLLEDTRFFPLPKPKLHKIK